MRLAVPVLELLLDEIAVRFAAVGTNVEKIVGKMGTEFVEVVIGGVLADQLRDEEVALIERRCDILGSVGEEFVDCKKESVSDLHRRISLDDGVGDEHTAYGPFGTWVNGTMFSRISP